MPPTKRGTKVDEYIQKFEQAPQTGDEQLLGYFFVGLQSKIRTKLDPMIPRN